MGRSDPGCQKYKIELGTSLKIHMVSLAGIRHLRKLFCHFRQRTREKTCLTIKTVVKKILRHIRPLYLIVALDGRTQESNTRSPGRMRDVKNVGTDIWAAVKDNSEDRHSDKFKNG